jgi:outer membrane protein assembly factor BamA
MRRFLLLLVVILSAFYGSAQNAMVVIDSIFIEGNKKTKKRILLRELTFSQGDSLPLSTMAAILEQNQLRLMNTTLFLTAKMNIKNWEADNHVSIQITVKENWYIFPIPIFELADRNFNVWWKEQKRDLTRTNYGMRFTFYNATGRRDPISALVQLGYTPKYSFSYSPPFVNKKQTIGLSINYYNAVNREVGYSTDSNKVDFIKTTDRFLQRREATSIGFNYTPGLFSNHYFSIGYSRNRVDTAISNTLNPDFFLNNRSQQKYLYLVYSFSQDTRDIHPYPLHGYYFNFYIQKNGVFKKDDANALDVYVRYAQYLSFSKKWSYESLIKGKTGLIRSKQPYTLVRGLGYGSDFIRGYEYYVIDGLDFAYSKNSLRYELFSKSYDLRKYARWNWMKAWMEVPVKSYLRVNFDAGYVHNPFDKVSNKLSNRALYGGGLGFDFVAYYNMIWRFEYSMNRLGEKGLYFSYSVGF